MTRRETRFVKWVLAVVGLALALGFSVPAFLPPGTAHGPRCRWYEAGNRKHFVQQIGLGFVPLAVCGVALGLLRSRDGDG
ncbi:MAG: hypothetical protein ACYS9X_15370 [Planctomycetota bacterium]